MMENASPMDSDPRGLMPATDAPPADNFVPLEDFDTTDQPTAPSMDSITGLEAVHDVPVTVQAVLGRARIAIGALMQLKANAVIELDRRVGEPVDIFVNNRLIARGEVVLIDNSLGVTLTEIVRQER